MADPVWSTRSDGGSVPAWGRARTRESRMPNGSHLFSISAPVKRPIRRSAGTGWGFGTAAVIYAGFLQHATQPPFLAIGRVRSFPGDGQWRRQGPLDPGFGEVAFGREVAVIGHLHRLAVVPAPPPGSRQIPLPLPAPDATAAEQAREGASDQQRQRTTTGDWPVLAVGDGPCPAVHAVDEDQLGPGVGRDMGLVHVGRLVGAVGGVEGVVQARNSAKGSDPCRLFSCSGGTLIWMTGRRVGGPRQVDLDQPLRRGRLGGTVHRRSEGIGPSPE